MASMIRAEDADIFDCKAVLNVKKLQVYGTQD